MVSCCMSATFSLAWSAKSGASYRPISGGRLCGGLSPFPVKFLPPFRLSRGTIAGDGNWWSAEVNVLERTCKLNWSGAEEVYLKLPKMSAKEKTTPQKLKQQNSYFENLSPSVNQRWLNRCIHHLLASSIFPEVIQAHRGITYSEESPSHWEGRIKQEVESSTDEDDKDNLMKEKDSKVYGHGFSCNGNLMPQWSGYWVGPDYEDGWGFVEASVSPADSDFW